MKKKNKNENKNNYKKKTYLKRMWAKNSFHTLGFVIECFGSAHRPHSKDNSQSIWQVLSRGAPVSNIKVRQSSLYQIIHIITRGYQVPLKQIRVASVVFLKYRLQVCGVCPLVSLSVKKS
jgi:hypothetical protein